MYYDEEELKIIFNNNKNIIDNAYDETKAKHNEIQANVALCEYLINYRTDFITRHKDARKNMERLLYHSSELYQFLIEYAMSSYILNGINSNFSLKEISAYTNTDNKNLKYDEESVVSVVAIGAAWNTYWMSNLIICNHKLKEVLVKRLIKERYINNQRKYLDNCPKHKTIKLSDNKRILISIDRLNRDIDNMIRDDEGTYYKDDVHNYDNYHTK